MLGTIGDLVEDVVVRLTGPITAATDTGAVIVRRRGGSAANAAVAAVRAGGRARFIGQVGDDESGVQLVTSLAAAGVEPVVRRRGRTGTIVVLLDAAGERTFLTDRGACALLDHPDPSWLDGLAVLHVPLYSLVGEPLATTAATLIGWAHERDVLVSIDASSSAVIAQHGPSTVAVLLRRLAPGVLLCNEMEAAALGGADALDAIGAPITIVKHGAADAIVTMLDRAGTRTVASVAACAVDGVVDTTGAGDAFAAGLLLALASGADAVEATREGHEAAATALRLVSAVSTPSGA